MKLYFSEKTFSELSENEKMCCVGMIAKIMVIMNKMPKDIQNPLEKVFEDCFQIVKNDFFD